MNRKIHALAIEYQWERTLLRTLLVMLAFLTFCYLYFVVASVLNVIARKEADMSSTRLEGSIGSLEQHYFLLSRNLTPETGSTLGLSGISRQSYVYRHTMIGQAAVAPTHGEI